MGCKVDEVVCVLVPYLGSSLGRGEHVVIAPDVEEVSGGSTLGGSLAELFGANRGVAAYSGHHGRGEGCQTRDYNQAQDLFTVAATNRPQICRKGHLLDTVRLKIAGLAFCIKQRLRSTLLRQCSNASCLPAAEATRDKATVLSIVADGG